MARANRELVSALRETADRVAGGAAYRWTHLGMCNCGQLAQTVTGLSRDEIRRFALSRAGEWADQTLEFCPTSGHPMDHVIGAMLALGLTREDIRDLERLRDPVVLRRLPDTLRRQLDHRDRDHVVAYMRAWADVLEEEVLRAETAHLVVTRALGRKRRTSTFERRTA